MSSVQHGLNKKQFAFVTNILDGKTAKEAYILAGYRVTNDNAAHACSNRLLHSAKVKAYLDTRQRVMIDRIEKRTEVTLQRIIEELARIAFFDKRCLYREDGSLKPPSEWGDEAGSALAGVETNEIGTGEDRPLVWAKKVKTWDKTKALDMLARMWNAYEADNKRAVDVTTGGEQVNEVKVEHKFPDAEAVRRYLADVESRASDNNVLTDGRG